MDDKDVIDDSFTDDLCGDIYNLSGTLSNLLGINSKLLGEGRNARLRRMKQVVFDTLVYYVDCLSLDEPLEDADEDIADYNEEEEDY